VEAQWAALSGEPVQVETLYFHPEFLVTSHMEHWSLLGRSFFIYIQGA